MLETFLGWGSAPACKARTAGSVAQRPLSPLCFPPLESRRQTRASLLTCDCLPAELGLPRTPKEMRSDPARSWARDVRPGSGCKVPPSGLGIFGGSSYSERGRSAPALPAEPSSRCQVSAALCVVFLAQAEFFSKLLLRFSSRKNTYFFLLLLFI